MKVYISADMEGTSGISSFHQVTPNNTDFEKYKSIWTKDINALIEGAIEAGATDILVNEGHNGMNYILPDMLHPKARLISGRLKPKNQMEGIEEGFDVAFLLCHAMAGKKGVLSHSFVMSDIYEMKLNGLPIGEIGLNVLMASEYGVPVGLIVSDNVGCDEAAELVPNIKRVETKTCITQFTAKWNPYEEVINNLKKQAFDAVKEANTFSRYSVSAPYTLDVTFSVSAMVELISYIPGIQVTGGRSVSYTCSDYLELTKVRILIVNLARMIGEQLK